MKNLLIVQILVLIVMLNSCVTKDSPQEVKKTVNSLPLSFGKPEENQQKPTIKVDKKFKSSL